MINDTISEFIFFFKRRRHLPELQINGKMIAWKSWLKYLEEVLVNFRTAYSTYFSVVKVRQICQSFVHFSSWSEANFSSDLRRLTAHTPLISTNFFWLDNPNLMTVTFVFTIQNQWGDEPSLCHLNSMLGRNLHNFLFLSFCLC